MKIRPRIFLFHTESFLLCPIPFPRVLVFQKSMSWIREMCGSSLGPDTGYPAVPPGCNTSLRPNSRHSPDISGQVPIGLALIPWCTCGNQFPAEVPVPRRRGLSESVFQRRPCPRRRKQAAGFPGPPIDQRSIKRGIYSSAKEGSSRPSFRSNAFLYQARATAAFPFPWHT
jgi:hypothetical protein